VKALLFNIFSSFILILFLLINLLFLNFIFNFDILIKKNKHNLILFEVYYIDFNYFDIKLKRK
jgi:hypothetical protein